MNSFGNIKFNSKENEEKLAPDKVNCGYVIREIIQTFIPGLDGMAEIIAMSVLAVAMEFGARYPEIVLPFIEAAEKEVCANIGITKEQMDADGNELNKKILTILRDYYAKTNKA